MVTVFTQVGGILAKYRAGKLPKAFKIIPTLRNWEEVLFVTDPDSWTAVSARGRQPPKANRAEQAAAGAGPRKAAPRSAWRPGR